MRLWPRSKKPSTTAERISDLEKRQQKIDKKLEVVTGMELQQSKIEKRLGLVELQVSVIRRMPKEPSVAS